MTATTTATTTHDTDAQATTGDPVLRLLRSDRYRWYHAAAFGLLANVASSVGFTGKRGNENAYYNRELRLPPFAPPGWVFGPAWGINNIASLWHNVQVLNLPADTPHRAALLRLQAVNWAIYATFAPVFFRLRSPILGAVWTVGMFLATLASAVLTRRISPRLLLGLAPLIAWLALASAVAVSVALRNRDDLFQTPPPVAA